MPTKSAYLMCIAILSLVAPSSVEAQNDSFALRAGRIMPVAPDLPWEIDNGVMIVRDGRIVAIGADVQVPPDLPLIELPHATVVPGLVAAASTLGGMHRGDESMAAGYRALDAFDRYGNFARTLAAGVTTIHLSPGSHRLLTGQGAVVRLGGEASQRILSSAADLAVNLGVPPPPLDVTYSFPASADVAIPVPRAQRPSSRMGQFQALDEAVRAATAAAGSEPFDFHPAALAQAWRDERPLRIGADRAADVLGSIRFLRESQRGGYVVGAAQADRVADAIRAAELPLVLLPRDRFRAAGGDVGTDPEAAEDHDWTALHDIKIALAPAPETPLDDLRLVAVRAARQGLSRRRALEAITRSAAEILGVADRVGSLAPGKDADFLVLTGAPLDVSSHISRVYVQGRTVFEPPADGGLVIRAGTIWAKPDQQIADGEILVENGKIVAVGRSVPHPPFARVIDAGPDGFVTPGFIDAYSHLGFAGDRTDVDNALRLSELFGAADVTELRVCQAGITTALVAPYAAASMGSPYAAIKTAGHERETRVVGDPVSVLFDVSQLDPLAVAETLGKPLAAGQKYLDLWTKYQKDLKEFLEKKQQGTETKTGDEKQEEESKEAQGPDPITGIWEAVVRGTPLGDAVTMTIEMQLLNSTVQGRASNDSLGLAGTLSGTFVGNHLSAVLEIERADVPGSIQIEADVTQPDRLKGYVSVEGMSFPIEGRRVDKRPVEIKVTRRRLRGKDGRPLPPKVDPAMEPLRALLEKKIPAVVKASSAAQIREVLDLLVDKHELPVVLMNAEEAAVHADRLAEKKVSVIVPAAVMRTRRNQDYLQADDLARRGVSILFQSNVEDGARHLPAVVLYAVERGLDAEQALAALTIEAARAFKIDERVGSIEPGKDADMVIFDGHPFKAAGQVQGVVVSGKEVRQ